MIEFADPTSVERALKVASRKKGPHWLEEIQNLQSRLWNLHLFQENHKTEESRNFQN